MTPNRKYFVTPVTDRARIAKKVAQMTRQGWQLGEVHYFAKRTEIDIVAHPPKREAGPAISVDALEAAS